MFISTAICSFFDLNIIISPKGRDLMQRVLKEEINAVWTDAAEKHPIGGCAEDLLLACSKCSL
jgi:hypothetical protein